MGVSAAARCPYKLSQVSGDVQCELVRGHEKAHAAWVRWGATCGSRNQAQGVSCNLPAGHEGDHQHLGSLVSRPVDWDNDDPIYTDPCPEHHPEYGLKCIKEAGHIGNHVCSGIDRVAEWRHVPRPNSDLATGTMIVSPRNAAFARMAIAASAKGAGILIASTRYSYGELFDAITDQLKEAGETVRARVDPGAGTTFVRPNGGFIKLQWREPSPVVSYIHDAEEQ
jgi:hypothetical protein